MKERRKKIKKMAAFLLMLGITTGMTVIPCSMAEAASEDVIIIAPDENTDEEEDIVISEDTEDSEDPLTDDITENTTDEAPEVIETLVKLVHPASFQAIAVKNGIKLSWKKSEDAQKYELYRKKSGTDAYTLIKTTKNCTYTDKTAKYGVDYVYKVRAIAVSVGTTVKSKCSPVKKCRTYHIDPSKPMVALTFDDGPSQYTPGILNTLEKYESRATFFEVGNRIDRYPDTVLRIDQMGCEIGNHSYDHAVLGNASASKIRSEISTTDAKIKAITGKTPVLFRPPYGSIGSSLRQNAGKPMILWSIDTLDWKSKNADRVYERVMDHVSDGDIILMHDLYSSTRDAVKRIIPELKKRGYQLVTVSELAQYKNKKLE
ncbi:polysaccharide deacetylase family protein [Frisingicoccus sp.]|uniref:polysaccharide deacetylase family protein n=1 Tax=Frisingicoccus sp. TaxID=1918627 RepID=UPI002A81BF50|nr:polysaccharide deacetylase family protein [Frisingicoccus sp.]MDY4922667.1 polysaccharide deacetylase family protein [Frisingicoccus sp.]